MKLDAPIIIRHNFDSTKFSKLFAMYTYGCNPYDHCNRSLKKYFSKKFNMNNPDFSRTKMLVFDEFQEKNWDAIYVCGVRKGYWSKKQNEVYPHNVHFAIIPSTGSTDSWVFENWEVTVENAKIENVISESDLDDRFSDFPKECTTCRIYRWSVTHYKSQLINCDYNQLKKDAEYHIMKHIESVNKRRKKVNEDRKDN